MIYKRYRKTLPYVNIFSRTPFEYFYSEIDLRRVENKLIRLSRQKEAARKAYNFEKYNAILLAQRKYLQRKYEIIKYRLKEAYK